MVNTEALNEIIEKSGKKKGYIAERIGITPQSLRKKILNITDFTTSEVIILCEELGITKLADKERIFFAKDVSETDNIS